MPPPHVSFPIGINYTVYISLGFFFLLSLALVLGIFSKEVCALVPRQPGRIFSEIDREGRRVLDKMALVHSPKIADYKIYQDSIQCTNYIKRTFFAGGHETKPVFT